MTELRKRMIECLQLRGLSERTEEAHVRAVRQLADYYHNSPDLSNSRILKLEDGRVTFIQASFEYRLSSTRIVRRLSAAGGNGFGRRAARILRLLASTGTGTADCGVTPFHCLADDNMASSAGSRPAR
jgi:hypothetical protein